MFGRINHKGSAGACVGSNSENIVEVPVTTPALSCNKTFKVAYFILFYCLTSKFSDILQSLLNYIAFTFTKKMKFSYFLYLTWIFQNPSGNIINNFLSFGMKVPPLTAARRRPTHSCTDVCLGNHLGGSGTSAADRK